MIFPLYYILFVFLLFLAVYAIFIIVDIYHLILFSEISLVSFFAAFIFLAGAAYLLFWIWTAGQIIDWQQTVVFFQNVSFESSF